MKRIGITQRVECVKSYSERRDCLDQRWTTFVTELGYIPLPLPNIIPDQVSKLLDALNLDALLFSGGNSIASLDPSASNAAPERDVFESALLGEALERNIPVVGICRGMQMINLFMGGKLTPISGHVAVRHSISSVDAHDHLPGMINSYHNWSISPEGLANGLKPIAVDCDGNIEAFKHVEKSLLGIMWHPEREAPFDPLDIELIKRSLL
ncbi:MAG: gamma-glutamyl-gamma-aminobutyrate hydrolase family protein [Candidatus Polarisedimenticolaceae bacterium]|nr:gamma-glutamyl-gamma-aminobutyrate hydrolase family protein [Candidatus Polarisedimenticolaceae bacterium]